MPTWYEDAKLGIMIHWGPYALSDRTPGAADTLEVIAGHWGRRGRYDSFARAFRQGLREWDPADTLGAVAASGARYLVVSAKHHDGFALWPARTKNPRKRGWQVSRDVVGELAAGARALGLKFGVYYSAGLDGTFSADQWPRRPCRRNTSHEELRGIHRRALARADLPLFSFNPLERRRKPWGAGPARAVLRFL